MEQETTHVYVSIYVSHFISPTKHNEIWYELTTIEIIFELGNCCQLELIFNLF